MNKLSIVTPKRWKDSVLDHQKILEILRKGLGKFLPCKQLEPPAEVREPHCTHDSIPCFDQVRSTSITKDTERTFTGIGRECASN